MTHKERVAAKAQERRWLILFVLCFSLLVIVLDNSILNVAIPSIVDQLHASNSQVQWIVDAYTLVFAGLLLTAGSLGDRFGRLMGLQVGFTIFGLGSLAAALAGDANQLIGTRAFMGIGAAFIMPATLSVITNVFPARERGKAISVWAATAGVATALGPMTGGFLLNHFYWGSVFLVNLPIVVIGLAAGFFLIPDSKDPTAPQLDPVGAVLSVAGLSSLLYGIIQAPTKSWTSASTILFLTAGVVILVGFGIWEWRSDHPMIDVKLFANRRFSAASGALTLQFFAMFGSTLVLTQYLQFVLGLTPLETGVRLLAFAGPMLLVSLLTHRFVKRLGTKVVVTSGLLVGCSGLLLLRGLDASSSGVVILWPMAVMASGMALVMAPATESIMGSLPLSKAGVGSAVNDTTRQMGGAIGVAVIGSVFASVYSSNVVDVLRGNVKPSVLEAAKHSVGAALKSVHGALADGVRSAFVDGFHASILVGVGVLILAAVAVAIWLPARARDEDVERQHADYDAGLARLARSGDEEEGPDAQVLVPEGISGA